MNKADVQKASPVNHPTASYQVATPTGFAWLASPPIITGIEDTVNDQVFQPRPRETQQRDILKLWERSNEFGSKAHARKPAGPSATHSQAA